MAIILENLEVDCYRGINELKLEDFNHVNILVGDNNAGKTSVMEMICALMLPLSVSVWNEIAKKKSSNNRVMFYRAYRNIFPIDKEMMIHFKGEFADKQTHCVTMTAEEYTTSITEREKNRINGFIRTGKQDDKDVYIDTNVMEITIREDLDEYQFEIYDFQGRPPIEDRKNVEKLKNRIKNPVTFVEPRDGLENDYEYMKDVILNTEYHEQMIEILREFDPAITDIISVEELGGTEYYVRTSEHKSAVPVSVYGDGLKKALVIFSAMVSSRNGIVMIDEVETSIHTSAMQMIFRTLIRWARKLDVQLFVSSHSKEAITTLLTCDKEYSDGINVYTLYRNNQKNYVRRLSCKKALDLQEKMGMELR